MIARHHVAVLTALAVVVCAAMLTLAGQPATPGQLRPRPGEGRQPEWPAPSITDYKPASTLVVAQHPVPKAKYPVIDIHSHQPDADLRRATRQGRGLDGPAEPAAAGESQRRLR